MLTPGRSVCSSFAFRGAEYSDILFHCCDFWYARGSIYKLHNGVTGLSIFSLAASLTRPLQRAKHYHCIHTLRFTELLSYRSCPHSLWSQWQPWCPTSLFFLCMWICFCKDFALLLHGILWQVQFQKCKWREDWLKKVCQDVLKRNASA